jgi:hypothetical protein
VADTIDYLDLKRFPLTKIEKPRAPRIEDFVVIWDLIAEGNTLQGACKQLNVHFPTVKNRIAANPDYVSSLAVANSVRADHYAGRAIDIAESLMDPESEVKPANAKAALPVFQWAAAQLDPQSWGKSRVEVTGKDGKDLPGVNVVVFELPQNGR